MFFKAKDMLRKAKNIKDGNHPTILSRWQADEEYRESLGFFGIWERNHALRPKCCGETWLYSYESWTNTKFKALGYLDFCWRTSTTSTTTPRLCRGKRECQQLHEYMAETKSISTNQFIREQQGNLPHTSSSSSSSLQSSSWPNWNSWWCPSSKPDEGHWVIFFTACSFWLLERSTNKSTWFVHRRHIRCVQHEHCSLPTSTDHIYACGLRLRLKAVKA